MLNKYSKLETYDSFNVYEYKIANSIFSIKIFTGNYDGYVFSKPLLSKDITKCISASLTISNNKLVDGYNVYGVINLEDFELSSNLLTELVQYIVDSQFHYYEGVPINLIEQVLKELMDKPINRCCICDGIEEYAEPKDGKVYCYLHCEW